MAELKRFFNPCAFNAPVTFHDQVTMAGSVAIEFGDNDKLTLGDDNDQVFLNRSAVLDAATALSGVIVGTAVTPAVAANSLIISNITASGDILVAANLGGNSQAWWWVDSSASLSTLYGAGISAIEIGANLVVNESGADRDFRVEGDTNANLHVIDAGTDSQSLGSAVVAGAGLSISNLTGRTTVTSVGVQVHVPAATYNDTGAMATIALLPDVFHGQQTHTATNARTYTDASALYLQGPPVASSNVTITNRPQTLTIAAGKSSFTPTATVASASSADLTGIAIPATTITITGTTQVTASQGLVNIAQATLTDSSAVTVDRFASLYIANAPTGAGMVTLSAPYAIHVDAGASRFDGEMVFGANNTRYTMPTDGGSAGEQLQTDGMTPAVLSWESAGSRREVKDVLANLRDKAEEALARVVSRDVYAFRYKKDARALTGLPALRDTDTVFHGVMAQEYPEVMQNNGTIFSAISAFGEVMLAIQALNQKVDRLAEA